jgi:hypothetical protein
MPEPTLSANRKNKVNGQNNCPDRHERTRSGAKQPAAHNGPALRMICRGGPDECLNAPAKEDVRGAVIAFPHPAREITDRTKVTITSGKAGRAAVLVPVTLLGDRPLCAPQQESRFCDAIFQADIHTRS